MNQENIKDIIGFSDLETLSLDLIWSWNHSSDNIWIQIDPELWELTHNPWVVLQTASKDKIKALLADSAFLKKISDLIENNKREETALCWYHKNYSKEPLSGIAYFSMEFMLSEALPIYSGGLGNVAGDQLKAASDLGVPVSAVGLLYQQGYFRQIIDKNGNQQALYPYNDPGQLPISPLRRANGEWLRLEIHLPGWSVWLRAWQVKVGKVKLYLLDSNDAENYPAHRGITSELYGGDSEMRLKQELVLGIGGWRLLQELGIKPEVCHLNEGHAAFAILERARCYMKETNQPFKVALQAVRPGNLFTTHTAVPAGFDRFSPELIEQYLGNYAKNELNISIQELLALGRENPSNTQEPFNMAYLAVRGSGAINAVSQLHGKVSRQIFSEIFPQWPVDEVPIGHVTNGVHMPSWDSAPADDFWTEACGKNRWMDTTEKLEAGIRKASDQKIWDMRNKSRKSLVEYARDCLFRIMGARGLSEDEQKKAKTIFNPNTLTLGFARRFATYKRPNLLLHDRERLLRILTNPEKPVQLILAGKAHPADKPGQELIHEWIEFIQRPEVRPHVIFLSDYDMLITEHLVEGVDVWINTPRRPWEACGTSGMKVLVNGGINLSELDGWWAEAYNPQVGWALGDGQEHHDDTSLDGKEAIALYELLENQVIPEFYNRKQHGIPTAWVNRIRESMAQLTPRFSANRAVREYTEKYYLPAAKKYHQRINQKEVKNLVDLEMTLKDKWNELRFEGMKIETDQDNHKFEAIVNIGGVPLDAIIVEIYANGLNGAAAFRQQMSRKRQVAGSANIYIYEVLIPISRPATDYTPRVIASNADVEIPLEIAQIRWQH